MEYNLTLMLFGLGLAGVVGQEIMGNRPFKEICLNKGKMYKNK